MSGANVRGAFRVQLDKPAIYITTKHKRVADIYFALLHELAHLKTDYNKAKNKVIIDSLDNKFIDEKADKTALNWMVNDEIYYKYNNSSLIKDYIKNNNLVESFFVYRLALDEKISYSSKSYQKYNPILEVK